MLVTVQILDGPVAVIQNCNDPPGPLAQPFTVTRQIYGDSCWHSTIFLLCGLNLQSSAAPQRLIELNNDHILQTHW